MAEVLQGITDRFVFSAPPPSYGTESYTRNLCWIPLTSPRRPSIEGCTGGIPCLWFPAPKAASVMLFFHANAEDLGMAFGMLKHIRDQFKVNVLAVEYPGYGLLSGMDPSEEAVYDVGLTAFRFLVDKMQVHYSQIILFGRSLGSGPAVYLASQFPVQGLILISAFLSIRDAVESIAGRFLAWACADIFPNRKLIGNVSCATLFIHGEGDTLIPSEHSVRLFKQCRARKLLITPPKMEHNTNLFADPNYLAAPAIHFFGFPGYITSSPPRMPADLFKPPERLVPALDEKGRSMCCCSSSETDQAVKLPPWMRRSSLAKAGAEWSWDQPSSATARRSADSGREPVGPAVGPSAKREAANKTANPSEPKVELLVRENFKNDLDVQVREHTGCHQEPGSHAQAMDRPRDPWSFRGTQQVVVEDPDAPAPSEVAGDFQGKKAVTYPGVNCGLGGA